MSGESNGDLEEGHEHCPVCNRINCPGAMDHCQHYFGSFWGDQGNLYLKCVAVPLTLQRLCVCHQCYGQSRDAQRRIIACV